jgi:undecaprenyl-diphosphatase
MFDAFLNLDIKLFILINAHHAVISDWLFWGITQLGTAWIAVPLVLVTIYIRSRGPVLRRLLLLTVLTFIVSGSVNSLLKLTIHRPRPLTYFARHPYTPKTTGAAPQAFPADAVLDTLVVHVVGPRLKHHAFPSGHSNTAFTAATVLACLYGGIFWYAYGAAILVAYSRVYIGAHFPLDTLGGALVGIICVVVLFKLGGAGRLCKKESRSAT